MGHIARFARCRARKIRNGTGNTNIPFQGEANTALQRDYLEEYLRIVVRFEMLPPRCRDLLIALRDD